MKIGIALIAISCLLASERVNGAHAEDPLPGPTELRNLASDLLRAEATAASDQVRSDTIIKLCDLFAVIRLHPAHDQSSMLRADEARIRRRLITTSQELRKQLANRNVARPTDLSSRVEEALAATENRQSAGSQQVGESELILQGEGASAGGVIPDDGWPLVELIQQTIRPDFWEVTGGPGTIRYFAMRRVLVVRATTEVHEDLAALLRRL